MNKKLFIFPFLSAVALLVINCSDVSKQKKWIYADIETKIWQEKRITPSMLHMNL